MITDQPPEYLQLTTAKRGHHLLGIDFETYRHLARTALAITTDLDDLFMGVYRLEQGCALDLFASKDCLTIVIDAAQEQLALWLCPMDAPSAQAVCLLQVESSPEGWRQLGARAREEIEA